MIDPLNLKYQERPIGGIAEDRLDRGPFVESLARALVRETRDDNGKVTKRTATGNVVGLVGKWGLGKSSILRILLQRFERTTDVAVVLFNPWLFKGRDELLHAFFNSMRDALGKSTGEAAADLVKALDDYWDAIDWLGKRGSAVADVLGAGGAATGVWTILSEIFKAKPKIKPKTVDEQRKILEGKLVKYKTAVVVLIDEVDRVEDDEVRSVAQLIKALGDIQGISYLVAYDQDRMVDALGRGDDRDERRRTGANYLEKIIQHPIPLRPLFTHDVDALLAEYLADHGIDLSDYKDEASMSLYAQIKSEITTPREIKRLVGSFAVLEEAVRGEINSIDLLAYCWILTKSPGLRDLLEAKFDKVVDDPGEAEMIQRMVLERQGSITAIEQLGELVGDQNNLLAKLFPVFGARRNEHDGTRLSLRRNLIRLLYLGNPPGMVRREEIETLWAETNETILQDRLQRLYQSGKLRATIDRLDDLIPYLPADGDRTFWPALARLLKRPHDWSQGFDERSETAREAAETIANLGRRNAAMTGRVAAIMNALIDIGDLTLAPDILRKAFFDHGLTRHDRHKSKNAALSLKETEMLRERELPRYAEALTEGTLLRRIVNFEAVYAQSNVRRFGADLRVSLTAQLNSIEAIGTLASLLVPPGYGADRGALNELFDTEVVKQRLEIFYVRDCLPENNWLRSSIERLRSVLNTTLPEESDAAIATIGDGES